MSTIEQIPADEVIEMTALFHRLFNAGGCNPMCHCCMKMLPVGSIFKLSTVEQMLYEMAEGNIRRYGYKIRTGEVKTKEVMLCEDCTPEAFKDYQENMFTQNQKEYERREQLNKEQGGGCFRINGIIVH